MNLPKKWLTLDPGESTGYAIMQRNKILASATAELDVLTNSLSMSLISVAKMELVDEALYSALTGVERVVYEDWALYPWVIAEGALDFDKCRTARGIGAVEFICGAAGIPYTAQAAKIKDTAEAGGAADLFQRPLHENRHANDALRHAVYYCLKAGEAVAWA